ncbi:hypothetical protein [Tissierella praeacuta]
MFIFGLLIIGYWITMPFTVSSIDKKMDKIIKLLEYDRTNEHKGG